MATTNKYDRQLRLWGASGQAALHSTAIVLVNATAAGTETLKNLVLPGVGAVHVVDGEDGDPVPSNGKQGGAFFSNFFVFDDADEKKEVDGDGDGMDVDADVGGGSTTAAAAPTNADANPQNSDSGGATSKSSVSRAEVACRHLLELNPDVTGRHTTVPSLETVDYGALLDSIRSGSASTFHHATSYGGNGNSGNSQNPAADSSSSGDDNITKKMLIVASDLPPAPLLSLSRAASSRSLPLLIVRTCGLIGTVRTQTSPSGHAVIESKPDSTVPDLRLACPAGPFEELKALADATDLDKMDSAEHGHVPYVIILIKALEKWRAETASAQQAEGEALRFPKTTEEKDAFRSVIKSMARGGPTNYADELNFAEAVDDAYLAFAQKELPWEVSELLEGVSEDTVADAIRAAAAAGDGLAMERSIKFDILLLALKKFLAGSGSGGQPPLDGRIPDMTAGTEPYIALQEAYRSRAARDRATMRGIVDEVLREQRGRLVAGGIDDGAAAAIPEITDEDVATYCRNVHNLRKITTRSYSDEWAAHGPTTTAATTSGDATDADAAMPTPLESDIQSDLFAATMDPYPDAPEHTPLLWHIAVRAADAFRSQHGRYPGSIDDPASLESDAGMVQTFIGQICQSMGLHDTDLIKNSLLEGYSESKPSPHAREIVRYDNAEIHNVASVVGGVASQEAVKLITGQYVPLDDTYVYNGIVSTAAVYRF